MAKRTLKATAVGSVSALALAAAGSAHALSTDVGNTELTIQGYAKLDMIYDVDADLGNSVSHGNLGSTVNPDTYKDIDGHTRMHAYQSRIGFGTATPMDMGGDLNTYIEGDFYGAGGGELRLRHAYGTWNGVLAGQTWSNFNTFVGTPPSLDFTGAVGQSAQSRQAQVRYTVGDFSVAVEDPDGIGGEALNQVGEKDSFYDLTARYESSAGPVNFSVGAVANQFGFDNGTTDDNATGFGAFGAVSSEVTPGTTIRGALTAGDGIGSYLYVNPAAPGYVDGNDIETISAFGGTVSVTQAIGPGALTVAYAHATADIDDAVDDGALAGSAPETNESLFANYIWSPVDQVSYGIEAGWHRQSYQDQLSNGDDDSDGVRIQASAQYSF
ncbi:DcaP family trimeric outer membrane transporter [Aquisalimonas lutea]|uniref:DcaP family trimeric outer membrane transporter n=1 Tax=Aquisalimonas lutea TaxID=1327750 RepID=UPI0025B3F677|nr:DcaP family trimeric outer membrane transporter [Aquisalimonas lutea]MDN3518635.1 DcaP family trimeric outer membrane transporter [Aquisalimonas lutea]